MTSSQPQDIYLEVLRALREQMFEMRARSVVQERILADLLSREIASNPDAIRALLADIRVNLIGAQDDIDPQHAERVVRMFEAITGAAERRAILLTEPQKVEVSVMDRIRAWAASARR